MKKQDYLEVTIKCFYKIPNQRKFERKEWDELTELIINDAYDAVKFHSDADDVYVENAKVAGGTMI